MGRGRSVIECGNMLRLKSGQSTSQPNIVYEILLHLLKLQNMEKMLRFEWVPAHVGVQSWWSSKTSSWTSWRWYSYRLGLLSKTGVKGKNSTIITGLNCSLSRIGKHETGLYITTIEHVLLFEEENITFYDQLKQLLEKISIYHGRF